MATNPKEISEHSVSGLPKEVEGAVSRIVANMVASGMSREEISQAVMQAVGGSVPHLDISQLEQEILAEADKVYESNAPIQALGSALAGLSDAVSDLSDAISLDSLGKLDTMSPGAKHESREVGGDLVKAGAAFAGLSDLKEQQERGPDRTPAHTLPDRSAGINLNA